MNSETCTRNVLDKDQIYVHSTLGNVSRALEENSKKLGAEACIDGGLTDYPCLPLSIGRQWRPQQRHFEHHHHHHRLFVPPITETMPPSPPPPPRPPPPPPKAVMNAATAAEEAEEKGHLV